MSPVAQIWPNWDHELNVRQGSHGCPRDEPPEARIAVRTLEGPAVWGGQAYHHFGHQIADHSTRIFQSAMERPNDPFLFLRHPEQAPPRFFQDIMGWFALAANRIRFVHEPVRVRQLYVATQAEQLPNVGPCDAYLDLLDGNWKSKQLRPIGARVVYVSRSSLTTKGCHAGQAYLCSVLQKLGVSVIWPEPCRSRSSYSAMQAPKSWCSLRARRSMGDNCLAGWTRTFWC